MAACTLHVGDRVALASVGGPPEVEYALFDPGEIELAAMGPGMVQEVGYQTTATDAVARLEDQGIKLALVLETACAMQPTLALAYARGASVRRIANALGPAELFEGFRYDAARKLYEGRWLDLPALATDTEVAQLTQTLQGMHLLAQLREVKGSTPVRLATRELMAGLRPGSRSYRRYSFRPAANLQETLRNLGKQLRAAPPGDRTERADGPASPELLEVLRERLAVAPDTDSRDRLRALEKAVGIRQRPMRGPLADSEVWALDEQLSAGKPEGVVALLDAIEKARGKQPASVYLRVRAALIGGQEAPRAIAEKIASLALSMPSFVELELLATEAWNAAGEPARALPFARDLISNTSVTDELRVRESQQQMAAVRAPPPATAEPPVLPRGVPAMPPPVRIEPMAPCLSAARPAHVVLRPPVIEGIEPPSEGSEGVASEPFRLESFDETQRRMTLPHGAERARMTPPPVPKRPSIPRPSAPPAQDHVEESRRLTPAMTFDAVSPSKPPSHPVMPTGRPAARVRTPGTWIGPAPPAPEKPSSSKPPRVRTSAGPPPAPRSSPDLADQGQSAPAASARSKRRTDPEAPRLANTRGAELMRGASQPPFRSDSPDAHVHIPRLPPMPSLEDEPDLAVALALPEGLGGVPEPVEHLPCTVLEARVQFTYLSRQLGQSYEDDLGIALRADVTGIEAMQRVLLERYGGRALATPEEAADVRRHGAFLSEILARTFGAFWVDIGPDDIGYWAMVVPPGTRVWPFGRILRLIARQHNERDLVAYFLELQGRAGADR